MHSIPSNAKLQSITATFCFVEHSLQGKASLPLLAVRTFCAFAPSKWDFVFSGVLAAIEWVQPQQVYVHKAYRAA